MDAESQVRQLGAASQGVEDGGRSCASRKLPHSIAMEWARATAFLNGMEAGELEHIGNTY